MKENMHIKSFKSKYLIRFKVDTMAFFRYIGFLIIIIIIIIINNNVSFLYKRRLL
jgi:hypothetical protein